MRVRSVVLDGVLVVGSFAACGGDDKVDLGPYIDAVAVEIAEYDTPADLALV